MQMGQSLACLGVLVALLAAALRWEPRVPPEPAPVVLTAVPGAPKVKPRVKIKVRVRKISADEDNSNSSYAALGLRATWVPSVAPSWIHRAEGRLESVNRSVTWTLKDLARKSILGRV